MDRAADEGIYPCGGEIIHFCDASGVDHPERLAYTHVTEATGCLHWLAGSVITHGLGFGIESERKAKVIVCGVG